MIDPRSNWLNIVKWVILATLGYFLLNPVAGIYEKTDARDVVYVLTFMAGVMGVDIPLTMLRRKAWKKDVETALNTEPPKVAVSQ